MVIYVICACVCIMLVKVSGSIGMELTKSWMFHRMLSVELGLKTLLSWLIHWQNSHAAMLSHVPATAVFLLFLNSCGTVLPPAEGMGYHYSSLKKDRSTVATVQKERLVTLLQNLIARKNKLISKQNEAATQCICMGTLCDCDDWRHWQALASMEGKGATAAAARSMGGRRMKPGQRYRAVVDKVRNVKRKPPMQSKWTIKAINDFQNLILKGSEYSRT